MIGLLIPIAYWVTYPKFLARAGDTFTLEVPVVIRLTCDCAVADDAVMPIRAESSSWLSW